jgi:5-methyltetrahydropteroyltriglutamate--homocysteine methyltransferase
MQIPSEPIGSIPRPLYLLDAMNGVTNGKISAEQLQAATDRALRETIELFEATGSPVITDGEQAKPSFATYPVHGCANIAPGGVTIPFADGHTRQLPRLTSGPFRYATYASSYVNAARLLTETPMKQAVISASALSLLYPQDGIPSYSREEFLADLISEAVKDIRGCLQAGAVNVQIDFTEGRLAIKLDPSLKLLEQFIDLNNLVLERFSESERRRIGVHSCPGGDCDATHSADVDYDELLPRLFQLKATNFYIQLAGEKDRRRALRLVQANIRSNQRVFVGVTDPINPRLETAEEVCSRVLEAAEYIPLQQLGTTDDCGFAPFGDDVSTSRELAFEKIRVRLAGTGLALERLRPV